MSGCIDVSGSIPQGGSTGDAIKAVIEVANSVLPMGYKAKKSSALKAFENSRLLMQYSQSVGYLEVLTAQSTYLNALLQSSADQLEAQQAKINLYKALCR